MKNEKLKDLRDTLTAWKVSVRDLVVVSTGAGEQLLGEILVDEEDEQVVLQGSITLRDPKRILALRQMQQGGMSIQYLVGDYDLMEAGVVEVRPVSLYKVIWASEDSQVGILELYIDYLNRKREARAVEAGLVLPKGGIIPGRG